VDTNAAHEAAEAMRHSLLGDEHVDAQMVDPNPTMVEFQDFITSTAWGVWTRGGALSTPDRSLLCSP
jgi:4-carboxymuconolactone decarboxylase